MGTQRFDFTIGGQDAGGAKSLDAVTESGQRAQSVFDSLFASTKKLEDGAGFEGFAGKVKSSIQDPLGAAGDAAKSLLVGLGPIGGALSAAGAGLLAIGGAGMTAAQGLGHYSDQLGDAAKRLGSTIEDTFALDLAMKRVGGSMESVEGLVRKLSQTLTDTSEEGKKGREQLAALGVTAYDAATSKLRPMTDVMLDFADRLNEIPDAARRNAAALEVLGRGALAVLPDLLEVSEGMKRAKELGLSPTEQDIQRWDGYERQMAEVGAQWEALGRKLKEPLAAFVSVIVGGGGTTDVGAAAVAALKARLGGGLTPGAAGPVAAGSTEESLRHSLEILQNSGFASTAQYADIEKAIDLYFTRGAMKGTGLGLTVDRSSINAALRPSGGEKGDLEAAVQKFGQLQEQLRSLQQLGAPFNQQSALADQVQAQRAVVAGIEARIKATQQLDELEKELGGFEAEMRKKELSEVGQILAQRDALIAKAAANPGLRIGVDQRASAAAASAAEAIVSKGEAAVAEKAAMAAAKSADSWRKSWDEVYKDAADTAQRIAQQFIDTNYRVLQVQAEGRGSRAAAGSRGYLGLLGLSAAPGQESALAGAELQERRRLAQELYGLALATANLEQDAGRRRELQARAYQSLETERYQAAVDYELRLAELQRQRTDEIRNLGAQVVDGLFQGRKGIEDFFINLGKGWARTIGSNLAVEIAGGWSGHLTLPGQGTTASPTKLGRILMGTPLGLDPLKAAGGAALTSAGVQLSAAAVDLMVAARSLAVSSTGGGGGFSSAAGTFSRLAASGDGEASSGADFSSIWNSIPHSGGGHSSLMSALKIGGAAAASGFGLYSGVRSGGARGVLTATGSALAGAGAILSMVDKALKVAGPIGEVAGAALGLATLFLPDPKQARDRQESERLAAARYSAPSSAVYYRDRYGNGWDTDSAGMARPLIGELHVAAMDAGNIIDRAPAIGDAVVSVLEGRKSPRLREALRTAVRGV